MKQPLIPIGQFSLMTRLSQKALRLYGDKGVLIPAHIDPDTGYRYYRLPQVEEAQVIQVLRRLGTPLKDIPAFLADPGQQRLDTLRVQVANRYAAQMRLLRYLQVYARDEENETMAIDVQLRSVSDQPYVSRKEAVSIDRLDTYVSESINHLRAQATPAGLPFVIFHEKVDELADGEIEVGLPTRENIDGGGVLPAGLVAYTVAVGEESDYPEILKYYDGVVRWVSEHGHRILGSPRETLLTRDSPEEPKRYEIAFPIQ